MMRFGKRGRSPLLGTAKGGGKRGLMRGGGQFKAKGRRYETAERLRYNRKTAKTLCYNEGKRGGGVGVVG